MKLEEIEKLCAEATRGPWKLCYHLESHEHDSSCRCGYRGGIWGGDGDHMVCEMGSTIIKGEEGLEPPRYDRATELKNAEFIAASRELMPKLLAVAKEAKDLVDRLDSYNGLSSILQALRELEGEE